jgi:hypothetical protein
LRVGLSVDCSIPPHTLAIVPLGSFSSGGSPEWQSGQYLRGEGGPARCSRPAADQESLSTRAHQIISVRLSDGSTSALSRDQKWSVAFAALMLWSRSHAAVDGSRSKHS